MPNQPTDRPDAIVIGAGLAGLACAADLIAAGLSVRLLEASDAVGGRMRTDCRDGFLLDRGFQVFNTSYPQVKHRLRQRELRLRPFAPGVLIHTETGYLQFSDPTRRPGSAADLLPGRLASGRDLLALAILTTRDMFGPVGAIKRRPDRTTLTELAAAGVSEELVRTFSAHSSPASSSKTNLRPPPGSFTWCGEACCAARSACLLRGSAPCPRSSRQDCLQASSSWIAQ